MDDRDYEGEAGFDAGRFEDDVRRVCQNAIDFNGAGTNFATMASLLKDAFTLRMDKVRVAPCTPDVPSGTNTANVPSEARLEFYQAAVQLPPAHANAVLTSIKDRCPAAIERGEGEIRVNLDNVDDVTLCEVHDEQLSALQESALFDS